MRKKRKLKNCLIKLKNWRRKLIIKIARMTIKILRKNHQIKIVNKRVRKRKTTKKNQLQWFLESITLYKLTLRYKMLPFRKKIKKYKLIQFKNKQSYLICLEIIHFLVLIGYWIGIQVLILIMDQNQYKWWEGLWLMTYFHFNLTIWIRILLVYQYQDPQM